MTTRRLGFSLAVILALGAQGAGAQGLPGEVEAREAADTLLQNQIDQLRDSIGHGGGTATVDCGSGGSIAQALATGAKTIIVRGTCDESVTVNQDDVTLQADPSGGEIHGPDADANAVTVRGHRVTIDGLTVSGGRNGITGVGSTNLIIRNCTVQSTGRSGIVYINNAGGSVDTCQVRMNPRDGIVANAAQATITRSTINNNSRFGIIVVFGASAYIGLTDRQEPAGNIISQNSSNGITVGTGGVATIAMNEISGNGAGIGIAQASATLVGGNTIHDNSGAGIFMTSSLVTLGNGDVGIPALNTISGNGSGAGQGGITAFLGSSVVIRNASIQGNHGPGVYLNTRSQAQLVSSTVQGSLNFSLPGGFVNAGDGIRLFAGSALLPTGPGSNTISDNQGFGIQCFDPESSVNGLPSVQAPNIPGMPPESVPVPPFLTMSANALGDVSPTCTGF